MLNSRAAMVVSVELPTVPEPIAVPKYRPLCAAAAPNVLAAALAQGATSAPASSAPPSGTATPTTRRRRRDTIVPRGALTVSDILCPLTIRESADPPSCERSVPIGAGHPPTGEVEAPRLRRREGRSTWSKWFRFRRGKAGGGRTHP